jgi:hypothetical protein
MDDVYTAVIARKIKRGRATDYDQWLGRVATALHSVAGYDGMTVISSPDPQGSMRTLLIRFRSAEALSGWENSTVRRGLAEEGNGFSAAYYHTAPGLEAFFSMPGFSSAPSRWKMCLLTIPTVYLLLNATNFAVLLLAPALKDWPNAIRLALVIPIVVVLLTVCLPPLSEVFAPWLLSQTLPSIRRTAGSSNPESGS